MEKIKFRDLGISESTVKILEEKGYEYPTTIQEKAIPLGLKGIDFIGQSQTGTGKTMAFAIPIVERIDLNLAKIQALILCPTRELAVQVSGEINTLCSKKGVKSMAVYGGESIEKQIKEIKRGVQIVVGTPGRMLDHIKRKTIKLDNVKFAVLDEADEMLDMGFIEDIENILKMTMEDRQTMLFSATMPKEIKALSSRYLKNPETIKIASKQVTVDKIEQKYIKLRNLDKPEVLSRVIELESARKTIVFCNTKKMVDDLTSQMQNRGYSVEGLHGDMKQQKRDLVMQRFKKAMVEILIATDVAARGLDINDVDLVINYDLPRDDEQYVHRIGRTGRAGKTGKSYSFVSSRELDRLRSIERYAKCKVDETGIPKYQDIKDKVIKSYIEDVNSRTIPEDINFYYNTVEQIKETMKLETFLALVLKEKLQLQDNDTIQSVGYDRKDRDKRLKDKDGKPKRNGRIEKGMVRFHINIGKNHKIRVADLVATIAGECNIKGRVIGAIDLYDTYSFFEIPEKFETDVLVNMKNIKIRGRSVTAQRSNTRTGTAKKR